MPSVRKVNEVKDFKRSDPITNKLKPQTDMINIKQLPILDPHHWPNLIHLGYMTEVLNRTAQE